MVVQDKVGCSAVAQDEQQLMWAALLTAAIAGLWGAGRTGFASGVLTGVCLYVRLKQQDPEAPFQASCLPTVFVDDMLQPERCGYTGMGAGACF